MGKKGNNKNRKRTKFSLFHVVIAVVSIYVVITFIKQGFVMSDLTEKNEVAEEELRILKTDIKDLEKKIDKSETLEYIEKIAREELDMIKPHEIIYKDKNKQDESRIVDWQFSNPAIY